MNNEEIIAKFKQHRLHCGELIKRINDRLDKRINNALQELGVTFMQSKLIFVLYMTADGEATLKELEGFFGVAQSTMAGIASRLEKSKYIESYTDPHDRRIKRLRITEDGRRFCTDMAKNIEEYEQRLLSPLSEQEQVVFYEHLQRIYDNL